MRSHNIEPWESRRQSFLPEHCRDCGGSMPHRVPESPGECGWRSCVAVDGGKVVRSLSDEFRRILDAGRVSEHNAIEGAQGVAAVSTWSSARIVRSAQTQALPRNGMRGRMNGTVLDLPWWHWALAVCFAACSVGGVYVVLKVRRELKETAPGASDMLVNFRELRSQGELSEQEFRTIKTLLADEVEKELKDHGKSS